MNRKKFVMIPGPTPVLRSIQNELGRETTAFGDPEFVADFKELLADLNSLFNNQTGKPFVVSASGTFAMEMAIANTTKKGDNILVVSNGFFGDRFIELGERKGLHVDVLRKTWGDSVVAAEVDKKLSEKSYAVVTVTHVDTSTGVKAPIEEIGKIMKNHPETLYIVDGVCSTAAQKEDMDQMNIDILFTASQKAFGVPPGLSLLWANATALERRKSLGMIPEYYCDFEKWIPVMDDTSKYFATVPVNMIWALKEAVRIIKAEGLDNRFKRNEKMALATQKAMESLGFQLVANENNRAITLSVLIYPEGVNDLEFRNELLKDDIYVAGALGEYAGKAFRLGHMGNVSFHDLISTITVIEKTLYKLGKNDNPGVATGVFIKDMC